MTIATPPTKTPGASAAAGRARLYRPSYARPTRRSGAVTILAVTALAVAPFFLAPYATTTLTRMLVFALFAASLDLLVGLTGMPSLGHAAYFGTGAYAAGWVAMHVTPEGPVPLLAGAVAGAVAAAIAGLVAVRASGVFFVMLTLALSEVTLQVAESWESVTGGSNGLYGIPATKIGGESLSDAAYLHWYVLAGFAVGMLALWSLAASPFGATLRGIRDNELRMRALGYRLGRYKLAAFVAAGGLAGLAGGLLAAQQRLVTPADLGFTTSALVLLAVVIGGTGSIWGPCLGAAMVILIRDALGPSLDGHGPLLLGLVFIAVVFAMPRGIAGIRLRRWMKRRSQP